MIDFTTSQLTWIIIGATGIGGTGYLTMSENMNRIDTKLQVTVNQLEHNNKQLDRLVVKMEDLNKNLQEKNTRNK